MIVHKGVKSLEKALGTKFCDLPENDYLENEDLEHWCCGTLTAVLVILLLRAYYKSPSLPATHKVVLIGLAMLGAPTAAEDSEGQTADFIDYTEAQALGETGFDQTTNP